MKKFLAFLLTAAASVTTSHRLIAQQSQADAFMNKQYFDTSCSPCKDFYQFANGSWLKNVVIPAERNSVTSADAVGDRNRALIREILDSLAYAPQRHARNDDERKLGIAYCNCMDTTSTASESLKYLQPELDRIKKIKSLKDLSAAIGRQQLQGITSLFWFVVINDDFDPTSMIAEIRNFWSWGLDDQSSYFKTDSANIRLRSEYMQMLTQVFTAFGDNSVTSEANAIGALRVETALAKTQPVQGPPVNNKISIEKLQQLAPSFKWKEFLKEIGRPDIESINIRPPALLHLIDSLVANISITDWKAYLLWRYIAQFAGAMPDNSIGSIIQGVLFSRRGFRQAPPKHVRCINSVNLGFANALGQAFVERNFSHIAKEKAIAFGNTIIEALRESLLTLDWLTPETRIKALVKLDSTKMQIGYPDKWPDEHFPALEIKRAPYIATRLSITKFHRSRELAKIGNPAVIPWFDAPTFSGAWYYATANTFSITAAYLQPPFFDPEGSDIANYAAVGVTFGHELSHGFDNGGRLYNEFGLRKEWWTPEEIKEFNRRAELIVKQYSEYIIVDTIHQNGRSTLSENIADIGGVRLAYEAFKKTKAGQSNVIINGYSPDQWFFIAFAQSTFRRAVHPALLPTFANSTHSFHKFRVNGPLSNMPEFAAVFGCKQGDAMVRPPSELGQIWK